MIVMYALFALCAGSKCAEYHAVVPSGMLLYTTYEDCTAAERELSFISSDPELQLQQHCSTIYFADYAQAERLLYGKVLCFHSTTLPESVMSRSSSLNPYAKHCGTKNHPKVPELK